MTEANQEQWSSKMKEKRANYLARMSEQQKDAMRKRDKERKKAKREAAKMATNMKPVEMYQSNQLICTWVFTCCSMTKLKEHSREIC